MFYDQIHKVLNHRILSIAGSDLTPGSILVGVFVFITCLVIASLASAWIQHRRVAQNLGVGGQFALSKIVHYALIGLGALASLNAMGVHLDSLFAASAVLAVGVGFGMQSVSQNFVAGLVLLFDQPVRKGDFVKVVDVLGVVEDIGLLNTLVVTRDDVTIIVPNTQLVTTAISNQSRPSSLLRVPVTVSVAYDVDMKLVEKVVGEVVGRRQDILKEPPYELRCDAFDGAVVRLSVLFWISDPRDDAKVSSHLRFDLIHAFREEGIEPARALPPVLYLTEREKEGAKPLPKTMEERAKKHA